jgi:hypothetical protein
MVADVVNAKGDVSIDVRDCEQTLEDAIRGAAHTVAGLPVPSFYDAVRKIQLACGGQAITRLLKVRCLGTTLLGAREPDNTIVKQDATPKCALWARCCQSHFSPLRSSVSLTLASLAGSGS